MTFLGERVQFARSQQNLTMSELAERIGITQGHLSNIENGKRTPGAGILSNLARELGVREDWLIRGEEPMYVESGKTIDDYSVAGCYLAELTENIDVSDGEYEELLQLLQERLASMKDEVASRLKRRRVESPPRNLSTRGDAFGGNVIQGSFDNVKQVIAGDQINVQKHTSRVINLPPVGSISEAQAKEIHGILVRLGELESLRIGPQGYGAVMNQFKQRYHITSYKNLPVEVYAEAVEYLNKRKKILEKALLREGKNPITKSQFIRDIQTICRRELKWTDPIRRAKMMERFGKASLTDFTMAELEDFRNYVSGLKRRTK